MRFLKRLAVVAACLCMTAGLLASSLGCDKGDPTAVTERELEKMFEDAWKGLSP
ncbi:MAG: hypothetical protein AB7V19_01155 [Candidatus Bipolaricaulia bacterium]